MQKRNNPWFSYSLLLTPFFIFSSNLAFARLHVHGEGEINIVNEDDKVVISFLLSGSDIVGFEHAPKDKQQKLKVDRELSKFKTYKDVFLLPDSAYCQLLDKVSIAAGELLKEKRNSELQKRKQVSKKEEANAPSSKMKLVKDQGGHNHKASAESVGEHSDIEVSYMFECRNISQLKEIKLNLFELFPTIKNIKAQFLSVDKQLAAKLNSKKPILKIK